MTYLPSPAEAAVAAEPLKHASRRPHLIGTPSGQHGWLAPVLLGSAAALGAAALYTAKKTREAERQASAGWALSGGRRCAPALP